jgi:type VI secretion system secreted protein Hcp
MRGKLIAVGAATLVVVAGGATYALAQGSLVEQTLRACVSGTGLMRLVDAGAACRTGETAVEWNNTGPAGPAGPAGPQGPSAGDASALDGTIMITGAIQGSFQGPKGQKIELMSLNHEVVSPRDAASGLPTGKRQHKPLTITKEIDKATPLIMNALINNETLTEVLIGMRQAGGEVMTIMLVNASVAERRQHGPRESVSFTYQKIIWTWLDGGITAEDDWEAPVG